MALIKCPECGKRISSATIKCLRCGYPLDQSFGSISHNITAENKADNSNNIDATIMPAERKKIRPKYIFIVVLFIIIVAIIIVIASIYYSLNHDTITVADVKCHVSIIINGSNTLNTISYTGEMRSGYPNGSGRLENKHEETVCEGTFVTEKDTIYFSGKNIDSMGNIEYVEKHFQFPIYYNPYGAAISRFVVIDILLFILFLFLLTSCFRSITIIGMRFCAEHNDVKHYYVYNGQVKNGLPDGHGKLSERRDFGKKYKVILKVFNGSFKTDDTGVTMFYGQCYKRDGSIKKYNGVKFNLYHF